MHMRRAEKTCLSGHAGQAKRIHSFEVRQVGAYVKKGLFTGGLLAFMVVLLWKNAVVGQAVREGLALCGRSVIPSLFPFFVTVSFATACGFFDVLRQMRLPLEAAVFLLGIIGGYPVGGRTVGELYHSGSISREKAEALLTFCNNAGPSFILSIAGAGVFGSSRIGLALYAVHGVSALLAGGLLGAFQGAGSAPERRALTPLRSRSAQSIPAAFVACVRNAALTMLHICAFVIFFLALMALVRQAWPAVPPLILGLLELTGGVTALPDSAVGFVMAAALLGWGGVSVHCQTAAVLEDTGLPMGRYLLAKALQGILSALLALPLCRVFF